MTTLTLFSDVAAQKYNAKVSREGVNVTQKATITLAASTVSGANIGMIRFQKGFSLVGFSIKTARLDTGNSVTFNIGYLYDGTTGESNNAFLSASTIPQSGGDYVWPVSGGLLTGVSFTATDDGYLSITTGGGSTTTQGVVTLIAVFTYAF